MRLMGQSKPVAEKLGSGPAHYMEIDGFEGKIGFISAISHKFCGGCNRVRMTADGFLKPCLQYETGMDLRTLLRDGASDAELKAQIEMTITQKPKCHHFGEMNEPEQTRNTEECLKLEDNIEIRTQRSSFYRCYTETQSLQVVGKAGFLMGKVRAVCISEKRGTQKKNIESAVFVENWGIEGDAHAGNWHRQISLLSEETIAAF